jgi:hypothetical protein
LLGKLLEELRDPELRFMEMLEHHGHRPSTPSRDHGAMVIGNSGDSASELGTAAIELGSK